MTELEMQHAADFSAAQNEERFGAVEAALTRHVEYNVRYGSTSDVLEFYGVGSASGIEAMEIIDVLEDDGLDAWESLDAIAEILGDEAAEAVKRWLY